MRTREAHLSPSAPPAAGRSYAAAPFLQTKLTVGPADDPFEREADRVAERVVQRATGPLGISAVGSSAVQRCGDGDPQVDDCDACRGVNERPKRKAEEPPPLTPPDPRRVKVGHEAEGEDDHKIQTAALPGPSARSAAAPAAPAVEAGIRQAQGGGRPLPEPVRHSMESSFGADFHLVRVHSGNASDRLNRSLSARAFTTGRDIFFRNGEYRPESRAGQRLLAHELTHVVQQGAAAEKTIRRKFAGPQLNNLNLQDAAYPGHALAIGAVHADTGCATQNQITTAGEKINHEDSDAGDPNGFAVYRDNCGPAPGLVKDRTRKCAATRMHLINHHLDAAEGAGGTQKNPNNIMMGTQKSNNPTHLRQVEAPLLKTIALHASRKNALYEAAMKDAVETKDPAGKAALFWDPANEPDAAAVKGYEEVYLSGGDPAKGYRPPAAKAAGDTKGFGLTVEGYAPPDRYNHLWLVYRVTANYSIRPAYVDANIARVRAANDDGYGNPVDAAIEKNVKDFDAGWADHAFPRTFNCEATYFSATYKKWGANKSYRAEQESQLIASDL